MTPAGYQGLGGLLVAVVLVGAASACVTGLVVQDQIFAGFRQRVWRYCPHPADHDHPRSPSYGVEDLDAPFEVAVRGWRAKIGYILTCPRCMGIYVTAAWYTALWAWPRATTVAAASVQRLINARTPG